MVAAELRGNNENFMKLLLTADLHFYDYPQRNPSEKFRLKQTKTVCKNIIEVGKKNGCDGIVIAGDLVEKYLIRPYVQYVVKEFLDELMKNFKVGYLIYGNHDIDSKSSDSKESDSCLGVMLPKGMNYMDKKEITIDGHRIGFMNWQPEFDLSWIGGELDALITHATIAYTDDSNYVSQSLDTTKFKVAFCGDIHSPGKTKDGKFVSIGIPQKCKMGDSDKQTGIVLDCSDMSYSWVNLNPHDNLLKFDYVEEKEKEGYDQPINTWHVYKPKNITINNGSRKIKIPEWANVKELMNKIIVENGLTEIHDQVLKGTKNSDLDEVNFDFTITYLHCVNWRSIGELELYFNEGEKVLIRGENGSGKSSFLSAIKYAFLENPHIKDFIQFGSTECFTEVEFLFENNKYKIKRGSKSYAFFINGTQQKYNNKREFEKDMHKRFKFIDYMDLYFLDPDNSRLLGNMTGERKSTIISKFFKLDYIDLYNNEANILLTNYLKSIEGVQNEVNKNREMLDYVESKLKILGAPEENMEELLIMRKTYQEMHEGYNRFIQYQGNNARLNAQIESAEKLLKDLKSKEFRSDDDIENDIKLNQYYVSRIQSLLQDLSQSRYEGNRIYKNRQDLDKKHTCPTCGQEIKDENLDQHKAELEGQIKKIGEHISDLYKQFKTMGISEDEAKGGAKDKLYYFNNLVSTYLAEKSEKKTTYKQTLDLSAEIGRAREELRKMGPIPEHVELPADFYQRMQEVENKIGAVKQFSDLKMDQVKYQKLIEEGEKKLGESEKIINLYNKYIRLTSPIGEIYQEILEKLSTQFSDNRVHYKVIRSTFRGKEHLDLESFYVHGGGSTEVLYENCSSGQKSVLDVTFLSKVCTRLGLLVMDEFLKFLDMDKLDWAIEQLGQMNIGLFFLSSHVDSIQVPGSKTLNLKLNESGISVWEMN